MDAETRAAFDLQEPGLALLNALDALIARDSYLLQVDANERTITCQIARYLAAELPQYHVDCEYNRDGVDPKKLQYIDLHGDEEDTFARTVFPDIIVHCRNTKNNYLVLEVKKTTNPDDRKIDYAKLVGYKKQLGFQFAVFVELAAGQQADVHRVDWI